MQDIYYDIHNFYWSKESNTFYQDACVLDTPDHPEAFPNRKGQFFIKNYDTGGFRRFRLVTETKVDWIYESEDGIKCVVCVDPESYDRLEYYAAGI